MKFSFILIMASVFLSFMAHAEVAVETNIKTLTNKFHKVMMVCPERIWTDFDWDGKSVLFFRPAKTTSLVWQAETNDFIEIENNDVPVEAQYGIYSFFEFQGRPTMSLLSQVGDFSEPYMFNLGVHEMFHYQGQIGWTDKSTGGRYTEYPLNAEPRFLRRLIYDNLESYFVNKDEASLAKARFWYDEWSTLFPTELLAVTDGYEGTAEYVDTMAEAIVAKGCDASDVELKSFLDNLVQNDFGRSVSGERFALDAEGYDIGGLAALILRFDDRQNLSEWNAAVVTGITPLEIILDEARAETEERPDALESFFTDKEQTVNEFWGSYLDDDIANWNNPDYIKVYTPFSMVNGAFIPAFFAYSSEIKQAMFPFGQDQIFISPLKDKSNFTALESTVLVQYGDNPCGEGPVTLIHKDKLGLNDNSGLQSVEAMTPTLQGLLVGEKKIDADGFEYFCLQ